MGRHHPTTNLIISVLIALVAVICLCRDADATPDQELRLFIVEKSKNPQNILVVYATVNATCEIQPIADAGRLHLFDFYWLMNRTTFKPTHRLIKKAARKRFVPLKPSIRETGFTVSLTDLKELNHDLPSDQVLVEIHRDTESGCRASATLTLGPAHANRTMTIETIYSEAKTFLSIPVGIHYIELRGRDVLNGEPIFARFSSSNINVDEETYNDER